MGTSQSLETHNEADKRPWIKAGKKSEKKVGAFLLPVLRKNRREKNSAGKYTQKLWLCDTPKSQNQARRFFY
jgi:hypothetical protein